MKTFGITTVSYNSHFQSDDRLEEEVSRALEGLTDHGLLVKVNDNEYKLVKGELLDSIVELIINRYILRGNVKPAH